MTAQFPLQAIALSLALFSLVLSTFAYPYAAIPAPTPFAARAPVGASLKKRTDEPTFPSDIASCPICEASYSSINSCAEAAPVLENFTMIIFNPGAFIDVIECACTDTFQSAYPQCVDCFIQTNQTSFLNADQEDLPSVVTGMRKICALESTLLGGVASADGEVSSSAATSATPTATTTSGAMRASLTLSTIGAALLVSVIAALL